MTAQPYTLNNVHAKSLLDYGDKKNQKQAIFSMNGDDEMVTEAALKKSQVQGSLSLESVILVAEFKIAERDAALKERWLPEDRTTLPSLPCPLEEVLKTINLVKSASSKFLSWLLPGQKFGERYFAGWFHKVDTALFVHTSGLMPGLKDTEDFSLQDIIDFKELKNMKSLSHGNIAAIKKESKVKTWSGFLKIFLEWREIVLNGGFEAVPKVRNKKKESIQRKETSETEDSEDELFVPTPAKKMKFIKKKAVEKRTPKDTTVAKAFARKRINELRSKNKRTETDKGGADDQTHLAIALQVSVETERNRQEELDFEMFENDSDFEKSISIMNNEASRKSVETELINNVYDAERSVSDIFAETVSRSEDVDTSSDEYYNRQPSGTVSSSPSLSVSPQHSKILCSSPNLDAISSPNFSFDSSFEDEITKNVTSTPATSRQNPAVIPAVSPVSTVARKSVIVKHITVSESPEKVVANKTIDMTKKCEQLKPKNRKMRLTRYSLDRKKDFMDYSHSETETDEDEDENNHQKDMKICRIIPKKVADSLKKGLKIETPVNLQLESVAKDGNQTHAKMSDTEYIYEFVVSKKLDFLLEHEVENYIKPNSIITITEIKKTKGGKRLIKDWFIDKKLQVQKKLGNPVVFMK